jgi:hypothetical protein
MKRTHENRFLKPLYQHKPSDEDARVGRKETVLISVDSTGHDDK